MGTRSRTRALLDRRIASGQNASVLRKTEGRWPYCAVRPAREYIDTESELNYWRSVYGDPMSGAIIPCEDFEPAIKLGLNAFLRRDVRCLNDIDEALFASYERTRGESQLEWQQARPIVEAVWRRLTRV